MTKCRCGCPTPALDRIQPTGTMGIGRNADPMVVTYLCPGERPGLLDRSILRFGVIAGIPFTCTSTRMMPWLATNFDLRRRANLVELTRLHAAGAI